MAQIATHRIMTAGGIVDVPVYNLGDVVNNFCRVQTELGVGCYSLVTPTANTPLRVQTHKGIFGILTVKKIATVLDTFNRADSTDIGMTGTGELWRMMGTFGSWGITANQASPVALNWNVPLYVETGLDDDYDYEIRHAVFNTTNQIMWRIVDASNYFIIENTTAIRVVNDVWQNKGSIGTLVNGDLVTIKVRDDIHRIFVNGVEKYAFIDNAHLTATKLGFSTNSTATRYDDFKATPITPGLRKDIANPLVAPILSGNIDLLENNPDYYLIQSAWNGDSARFPLKEAPIANKHYELKIDLELVNSTTHTVIVHFRNDTLSTTVRSWIFEASAGMNGVRQVFRGLVNSGAVDPAHVFSIVVAHYWDGNSASIQFKVFKTGFSFLE